MTSSDSSSPLGSKLDTKFSMFTTSESTRDEPTASTRSGSWLALALVFISLLPVSASESYNIAYKNEPDNDYKEYRPYEQKHEKYESFDTSVVADTYKSSYSSSNIHYNAPDHTAGNSNARGSFNGRHNLGDGSYHTRYNSGSGSHGRQHSSSDGSFNTRYSEVSTRISVGGEHSSNAGRGATTSLSTYQYGKSDRRAMNKSDRKKLSSSKVVEEKSLRLHGVAVPVYKFRGEDAQLECQYDKGTDPLYSVKWYKDDDEFFRYLYGQERPKQVFDVPGVIVDINRSNERLVLLQKLTFSSTGIYRCEVSADSPHFHTYTNQSVMVVVELPSKPPTITGGRSHYKVGDTVHLNCTSARSMPAPSLTWYINGVEAASHLLEQYHPRVHRDQLESKRLGLTFQVEDSHFRPKGEMEMRCRATVSAVYSDGEAPEMMPVVLEHREDVIRARNRGSSTSSSLQLAALAVVVMGLPTPAIFLY